MALDIHSFVPLSRDEFCSDPRNLPKQLSVMAIVGWPRVVANFASHPLITWYAILLYLLLSPSVRVHEGILILQVTLETYTLSLIL